MRVLALHPPIQVTENTRGSQHLPAGGMQKYFDGPN